jgi:hypothetical protein
LGIASPHSLQKFAERSLISLLHDGHSISFSLSLPCRIPDQKPASDVAIAAFHAGFQLALKSSLASTASFCFAPNWLMSTGIFKNSVALIRLDAPAFRLRLNQALQFLLDLLRFFQADNLPQRFENSRHVRLQRPATFTNKRTPAHISRLRVLQSTGQTDARLGHHRFSMTSMALNFHFHSIKFGETVKRKA